MKYHRSALIIALLSTCVYSTYANQRPIAVVQNSPLYIDTEGWCYINLAQSYDPDGDELQYEWKQISGSEIQTSWSNKWKELYVESLEADSEIQEIIIEFTVNDGHLTSEAIQAKIVIIPDYEDQQTYMIDRSIFDPNKPTILGFGAGDCTFSWPLGYSTTEWTKKANWFTAHSIPPYHRVADQFLRYISSKAPNYKQPIQTIGFSSGADVAFEVARRLNIDYGDPRYMVNRLTILDALCLGKPSAEQRYELAQTLIDGESCWIDNYSTGATYYTLNVRFLNGRHFDPYYWYPKSINTDHTPSGFYNDGIAAGYYLSVIGPAKNLFIPPMRADDHFFVTTEGNTSFTLYNKDKWPGLLPEPIHLIGPARIKDANSVIISCSPSQHVVRYQVIIGNDSYRTAYYDVIQETETVPTAIIDFNDLPYNPTWITIRGTSAQEAMIHADPVMIVPEAPWPFENTSQGYQYQSLQAAVRDANPHDVIVLSIGTYKEHIDFNNKPLTIQSSAPDQPDVVENTILIGTHTNQSLVQFDGITIETPEVSEDN